MKEYSEEFKCFCLVLSLFVILFSPELIHVVDENIAIEESIASNILTYAALTSFVFGIGVVINKLIPYQVKDWILYPNLFGHGLRLPGYSVFTKVKNDKYKTDGRFTKEEVLEVYANIYEILNSSEIEDKGEYQNRQWYLLFRGCCTDTSVSYLNSDYLFCRDITALSMFVFVASLLINVCMGSFLISNVSLICLGLITLMSWISAHFKALRLAITVLAVDIANKKEER